MPNDKLPVVMLTIRRGRPPSKDSQTYRIPLPASSEHSVVSILESAVGEMVIAELEIGVDNSGQRTVLLIDDLESTKKLSWTPRVNNQLLEDSERKLCPGDTVLWELTKA